MAYNIIFIHLLNDASGSPMILKEIIEVSKSHNIPSKLYIGSHGDGILSKCGIPISRYWYYRSTFRIMTLFSYIVSQFCLFFKLICDHNINKNAIIYVNTLLPFGAAIYAKTTGRKVIYHFHEISISPKLFQAMLLSTAEFTSSLNIYVSKWHMKALNLPNISTQLIYNCVGSNILSRTNQANYIFRHNGKFKILLIASLRDYKGIPELIYLAESLRDFKDIHFDLVVNSDQKEIDRYFSARECPTNLVVHPRTLDTASFYCQASLLLNLSRVDQWVETFGLTILEAMAFGIPVIVPPVGGPAELVIHDIHGFHIDSYNLKHLRDSVLQLYKNPQLHRRMSKACRARAAEFSPQTFAANIMSAIDRVRGIE